MTFLPSVFPALPQYPGPHKVGSIDLEFQLPEKVGFSETSTYVETIAVRIFYPIEATAEGISPPWLPSPYLEYAKGYAKFLKQRALPTGLAIGALVYNTTIPCIENASPLKLDDGETFPLMIFSHGLGGTRAAYSQWCGSMASHGMIVAAIEHRDMTAPISVVKIGTKESFSVPYVRLTEWNDHTRQIRGAQMKQRALEVARLLEILRDINEGRTVQEVTQRRNGLDLGHFRGLMDTRKGHIIMSGHSFGGATAAAVCKDKQLIEAPYPLKDEFCAAIILDIWMQPLSAIPTTALRVPSLHIISQQFLQWSANYAAIPSLLHESRASSSFARAFYVAGSAHLSQSDFQLLFPWICRKAFGAEKEAERVMELNVRACLEFLRRVGIDLAGKEDSEIFGGGIEDFVEFEKEV